MSAPVPYAVTRVLMALACLLALGVTAAGLRHEGPLHDIGAVTDWVTAWVQVLTEVFGW